MALLVGMQPISVIFFLQWDPFSVTPFQFSGTFFEWRMLGVNALYCRSRLRYLSRARFLPRSVLKRNGVMSRISVWALSGLRGWFYSRWFEHTFHASTTGSDWRYSQNESSTNWWRLLGPIQHAISDLIEFHNPSIRLHVSASSSWRHLQASEEKNKSRWSTNLGGLVLRFLAVNSCLKLVYVHTLNFAQWVFATVLHVENQTKLVFGSWLVC